jgi:hypothetical protein
LGHAQKRGRVKGVGTESSLYIQDIYDSEIPISEKEGYETKYVPIPFSGHN